MFAVIGNSGPIRCQGLRAKLGGSSGDLSCQPPRQPGLNPNGAVDLYGLGAGLEGLPHLLRRVNAAARYQGGRQVQAGYLQQGAEHMRKDKWPV